MVQTVLRIEGMTCAHCVEAVTQALVSVPGVERAEVDLTLGEARILHEEPLDWEAVRSAVEQEGYRVGV